MTEDEFFAVLANMPAPVQLTRRLYHDDLGRVLFYSMLDLPGQWIEVDSATYAAASHDLRVQDGKIVPQPRSIPVSKLRPGENGTPCDPRDICLVVMQDRPHVRWEWSTHD